jgi:DNA-directed RNA polymerase specialized sigma24 family protein
LVLQEWQGDKSYGKIKPENNSNPDFVFQYEQREFAVECKWREKLDRDLGKELLTKKRIDNYTKFSKDRQMCVTIVLGVGGEPCSPELLYVIPLEKVSDIVSHFLSIVEFRVHPESFDISVFLQTEEQSKAYTIEEKRKEHKNAYKKWSQEEEERLLMLYQEGKSIDELTRIFERNRGAICSRIRKYPQNLIVETVP